MLRSRISRLRWRFDPQAVHSLLRTFQRIAPGIFCRGDSNADPRMQKGLGERFLRMRQLTSIVAMNDQGAIGAGNSLPWRVRSDMQFFRRTTLDQVVIMGRKTYQSLNGCLPRRSNVVVTHGFSLFSAGPDCRSAGAIDEALVTAAKAAKKRDVFVIGGAMMYEQFAPYVDRYLITMIEKDVPNADTFFRETWLSDQGEWDQRLIAQGDADGEADEAGFAIWEFVAKSARAIAERRAEAIARYQQRGKRSLTSFAGASASI